MASQSVPSQNLPSPRLGDDETPLGEGGEYESEAPLGVRPRGFWQHPLVQNVLPFLTSLTVHLGLVLIGIAGYTTYKVMERKVEEQIIIPDAAIIEKADEGAIPNPGLGGDPTRAAAQDIDPTVTDSDGWNERPSSSLQKTVLGGSPEEVESATIIGVGGTKTLARGIGSGTNVGSGEGGREGALAPFGIPGGGGGPGPKTSFLGISGNARRVVFVCDATGTMVGLKFILLQRQLNKAIDLLKPSQSFNIIFYEGGTESEQGHPFSKELVVASPANKKKAAAFVESFQCIGAGTNPLPALRMAFSQRPQLAYFLSDGQFNVGVSYDEVLDEVRRLNAEKKVKVNTIAFMSEDAKAEEALAAMAADHDGRFRRVTESDLD